MEEAKEQEAEQRHEEARAEKEQKVAEAEEVRKAKAGKKIWRWIESNCIIRNCSS